MIKLGPCKKIYTADTHRTRTPEDTLEMVAPLARKSGITRVADITKLDRLGIPVYSCIRPGAADGSISVYNGKGATPAAAKVSAIMEGIERHSSEVNGREIIHEKYTSLGCDIAVNPSDLILPQNADPDGLLPWVKGIDIINDEELYVPAHAVFHPYPHGIERLFRTSTNGIASGNTIEEATYHALAEVVERDAWSLVEASGIAGSCITEFEDEMILGFMQAFEDAGVDLIIRDITSDMGIPTVAAVADDVRLKDPALLCIGMGTHVSPRVAVIRAITEVAQSRATQIHGARENATEAVNRVNIGYERVKRLNRKWFDRTDTSVMSGMPEYVSDDFLEDIRHINNMLSERGFDRVIVCDLTMHDIGVPVVRVIVPGLECWAMDNERYGRRCADARRNRVSGSKS